MIAGVAAAAAAIALLVVVGDVALRTIFGLTETSAPPPAYLLLKSVISVVAAILGGFICAWIAPAGRVFVSVAVLVVLFLVAGAMVGRAMASPLEPLWFQAIVVMLGASGVPIGASIEQAWEVGRRRT